MGRVQWKWNWHMIRANAVETGGILLSWQWSFSRKATEVKWRHHLYTTALPCCFLHESKYFRIGGQIETARHNELSDECFETRKTAGAKMKHEGIPADGVWTISCKKNMWWLMCWNALLFLIYDLNLFFCVILILNHLGFGDFDLICKSLFTYDLRFWFKSKIEWSFPTLAVCAVCICQ